MTAISGQPLPFPRAAQPVEADTSSATSDLPSTRLHVRSTPSVSPDGLVPVRRLEANASVPETTGVRGYEEVRDLMLAECWAGRSRSLPLTVAEPDAATRCPLESGQTAVLQVLC